MLKKLTLSFILILGLAANAAVPDIGDNSFFECVEVEDTLEPGMCYGDITWVTDKNGVDRDGQSLRIKRARKILKNAIRFFKKKRNQATRQDDLELADSYEAKRLNAIQSRSDLSACYFDFYEACGSADDNEDEDSGDNSDANFPSLTEACNLISDPTNYGELQRTRSSKKFIVNGKVCSGTAASTSPVIKILLDNQQHCTGTYVAANTILTAAHCLENITCDNLSVKNSGGSQTIRASECIMHPNYGEETFPAQINDVAIIKLPNDFDGITPAKVNIESAAVGDDAAFAGYGRNENDDAKLRATFNQISEVLTEAISTFYVRGDDNEGTTCSGDSGGPLFVFSGGEWKTQGTLSDGSANDCALAGTRPSSDQSNWANLASPSNQSFIRDNTEGVLD